MPEVPIRKGFDILEEAEEIRSKQLNRPKSGYRNQVESQVINASRMQWHIDIPRSSSFTVWRDLLLKTRNFPKTEFRDDVSELRQEVDNLKLMVRSLTKTIESSNKTINELSKEILHKPAIGQKEKPFLDELCNSYVEIASKIEIAQKIYIVHTNNGLVCWTIVDSEPFDSTLLEPIYDAQVKIYREIKEDLELDFHVLNLSELHDRQELENILPPNSNLVWQR